MIRVHSINRLVAALLSAALLLAGCSFEQTEEKAPAMGRYVEEVVSLPAGLTYISSFLSDASGAVNLLGEVGGDFAHWIYRDGAWIAQDAPWTRALDALDVLWYIDLTMGTDGTPYYLYYPLEEGVDPAVYEGYLDDEEIRYPDLQLSRYDNGAWQLCQGSLTYHNTNPSMLKILGGGRMAAGYYNTLVIYGDDGAVLSELTSDDVLRDGNVTLWGNGVAFTDQGMLRLYDVDTDSFRGDIGMQRSVAEGAVEYATGRPPQSAVCWDAQNDVFCYANKSGIYQVTPDGQMTEKLVDGALTSLVMPTVDVRQLIACSDGSFLLYAVTPDNEPLLYRYTYEESVPTSPTTELRIYSLYDTPTIRQAMGSFQRNHPDVTVRYEIGIQEAGMAQDALQTLSTQILAGDGPDLFVLDGLPLDSYVEKGVLADLGSFEEDLFENIADTFRVDGALYAVPTAFRLPLMISDAQTVSQVQTPADLAAFMERQENPRIGVSPQGLLWDISRYYYPRWVRSDATLDTQVFAEDLEALGRIHTMLLEVEHPDGGAYSGDYITNALVWKEHSINLAVCSLFALNNLAGPHTAFLEREGVLTFYPQQGSYFIPCVILGANANTEHPALARGFIEHVLSEEQQRYELGDGLPVNRTAYRAILERKAENEPDGTYGLEAFNPETGAMEYAATQLYWPDRAFRQLALEFAQTASTPLIVNHTVLDILWDESERYFSQACTLEEAVQAAEQKINLILVE